MNELVMNNGLSSRVSMMVKLVFRKALGYYNKIKCEYLLIKTIKQNERKYSLLLWNWSINWDMTALFEKEKIIEKEHIKVKKKKTHNGSSKALLELLILMKISS